MTRKRHHGTERVTGTCSMLALFVLCASGCGDDDIGMMSTDDSGVMSTDDSGVMSTDDSGVMSTDGGTTASGDEDGTSGVTGTTESSADDPGADDDRGHGFCGGLEFGPAPLPGAVIDEPYREDLRVHAESGWSRSDHVSHVLTGDVPAGLELDPETVELHGVPMATGSFTMTLVSEVECPEGCVCSADAHEFTLDVEEAAATGDSSGSDGSSSGGSSG